MLLHTPGSRPATKHIASGSSGAPQDIYSDSRTHGYEGPTRHVRLARATSGGAAAIAKSEDGIRCIVAGRESLRILRITPPDESDPGSNAEHRFAVGGGGFRIEASRNFWDGSGLHMDSANTDVAWGHGDYSNKILTSARNGELIMWDLNKPGPSKYECRTRDHSRSIHGLAYSPLLKVYCMTGSADGDLRIWDLRDMSKSIMFIHHPSPVRAVAFSPIEGRPLQAITALDNGSIYRWDLNMGQRGQLDRIPAAHSGPILALDWSVSSASPPSSRQPQSNWYGTSSSALGLLDDIIPGSSGLQSGEADTIGLGWLASGGLDRTVKAWNLTAPAASSHISHDPTYTIQTAYPVRRVLWRPGHDCELAIAAHTDQGVNSNVDITSSHLIPSGAASGAGTGFMSALSSPRISAATLHIVDTGAQTMHSPVHIDGCTPIEIWDVRRGHIAKWEVNSSVGEGAVADIEFADSHAVWAQHSSGAFSQLDLRDCSRPLDAITRAAISWDPAGSFTFVTDRHRRWEIPYDDIKHERRQHLLDWQGSPMKALGDPPFLPTAQNFGALTFDAVEDLDVFVYLAQNYVYEGGTRQDICARNAKVSQDVGKAEAAQTWLMLQNLLTDLIPEIVDTLSSATSELTHSMSAPAAIPTLQSSMGPVLPQRSLSTDAQGSKLSLRENVGDSLSSWHSPLPYTPSSAASSPHRSSNRLSHYPAAIFSRRESNAGLSPTMRPMHSSSYRRPSTSWMSSPSLHSLHSDSPSDSVRSHDSMKYVGEGALDDSDSSGSENESGLAAPSPSDSGDEGSGSSSSRPLYPMRPNANVAVQPSPLAHQQTWSEDENEDGDSPSPGSSSESDSQNNTSLAHRPRRQKGSGRSGTRSRSSTVASLAVHTDSPALARQGSCNSIRTVVAATPFTDEQDGGLHREDVARNLSRGGVTKTSPNHDRVRSAAFSAEVKVDSDCIEALPISVSRGSHGSKVEYTERVRETEHRMRELGWEMLRDAIESFAEQGETQICAFLSIVAPAELNINTLRTLRYVESYIEILTRLRLFTAAAYMHKYVKAEELRSATTLQTTIYTSCSRCRKPLVRQATGMHRSGQPSGSFAYCLSCNKAISRCTICHLPIRALAFTCPVCMHGGHQECYRNYYMRRPTIELAGSSVTLEGNPQPAGAPNPPFLKMRGRTSSRSGSVTQDSDSDDSSGPQNGENTVVAANGLFQLSGSLQGHACAAGCGHFCWAAHNPAGSN